MGKLFKFNHSFAWNQCLFSADSSQCQHGEVSLLLSIALLIVDCGGFSLHSVSIFSAYCITFGFASFHHFHYVCMFVIVYFGKVIYTFV